MTTAGLGEQRQKKIARAEKAMPQCLKEKLAEIKKGLARCREHDVKERYEIACMIREVRDRPPRYGARALPQLAAALGRSEASLRQYAAVADAWPRMAEIEKLLKGRDIFGRALSWSHLLLLAELKKAAERIHRINDVLANGLSVRELKRLIGCGSADKASAPQAASPGSVRSALMQMTAQAQAVQQQAEVWRAAIFDRIKAATAGEVDARLHDDLQRARAAQQEAAEACERNAAELATCIKKLESAKSATAEQRQAKTPAGRSRAPVAAASP